MTESRSRIEVCLAVGRYSSQHDTCSFGEHGRNSGAASDLTSESCESWACKIELHPIYVACSSAGSLDEPAYTLRRLGADSR
jgi:hypothetical protein